MAKRFLNGLVFGAGFAVAFIIVLFVLLFIVLPAVSNSGLFVTRGSTMLFKPPRLVAEKRFLGAFEVYSSAFSHDYGSVLSTEPGRIVGSASINGEPLSGLLLRLALNGSVMSQWATTDANGRYEIGVPYGTYRIDGYELNRVVTKEILEGKIDHPQNVDTTGPFEVSEEETGQGLNLRFVDPVQLDIPKEKFSADEEIVIAWKAYPGANKYVVQVIEIADAHGIGEDKWLFAGDNSLVVTEPYVKLSDYIELKPGHYYRVTVDALKDRWPAISNTGSRYRETDFQVVE